VGSATAPGRRRGPDAVTRRILGIRRLDRPGLAPRDGGQIDISSAELTAGDLTRANLTRANLIGARLHGANLSGADPAAANVTSAQLTGGDLTEADIPKARKSQMDGRETPARAD